MIRTSAEVLHEPQTGLRPGMIQVQPAAPAHVEIVVQGEHGGLVVTLTRAEFASLVSSVLAPAELAAEFNGGRR